MLELSLQPTKYVRGNGQTIYTWDYKNLLLGRPIALDVLGIAPIDRLGELTWLGPASVVIFGLRLLLGVLNAGQFTAGDVTAKLNTHWWWYVGHLVLAVAGMVAQVRYLTRAKASMRQQWYGARYAPAQPL